MELSDLPNHKTAIRLSYFFALPKYEPGNRDNLYAGAQRAFGENVTTQYRFDQAQIILALDADYLACGPASMRYAHDFAARRRVRDG
jgi:hypothetical protein